VYGRYPGLRANNDSRRTRIRSPSGVSQSRRQKYLIAFAQEVSRPLRPFWFHRSCTTKDNKNRFDRRAEKSRGSPHPVPFLNDTWLRSIPIGIRRSENDTANAVTPNRAHFKRQMIIVYLTIA